MLQHQLRQHQLAGHDLSQLIDQITAAPMDGARSISSVLHGRLQRVLLPDLGHAVTWAQRVPAHAPQVAHELAAGLDERCRELGERLAATPEPWLARHLGILSPDASAAPREDYVQRAGTAAAYREARGITDPQQAVSFGPHPEPELAARSGQACGKAEPGRCVCREAATVSRPRTEDHLASQPMRLAAR